MACDNLLCIYLGYDLIFSIMITNICINNIAYFYKGTIILHNDFVIILAYFCRGDSFCMNADMC